MTFIDLFQEYKPNTSTSLALLFIFIIYIIIELLLTKKHDAFSMNSKPLTAQYLFKQAIRIPFLSALFFGFLSWMGHVPRFDSEGFNNFILISKLPIGLLSLTIPFVAVVNNMHRTIQTNTQIEEAQKKNTSDSYYSHFKYITDYFSNLPKRNLDLRVTYNNDINYEYCISYPVHLYKFLFSRNSPHAGIFDTDKLYIQRSTDVMVDIAKECTSIITIENKWKQQSDNGEEIDHDIVATSQSQHLHSIETSLTKLHKMLCINSPKYNYHYRYQSLNEKHSLITKFGSCKELSGRIDIIYQFLMNVLEITSFMNFEDSLREDKGTIASSVNYLRNNELLIFKLSEYKSGNGTPCLTVDGDNVAAKH